MFVELPLQSVLRDKDIANGRLIFYYFLNMYGKHEFG